MKRKRSRDRDDLRDCDLVLTDASGRSVRVHKEFLVSKSEYFARILTDTDPPELRLDEAHLIDLIQYLYRFERERKRRRSDAVYTDAYSSGEDEDCSDNDSQDLSSVASIDSEILHGDIEVLMQLLVLSEKYGFDQLHKDLMAEINFLLRPSSVITVFECASRLGIGPLQEVSKLMILTWLPQIYKKRAFLRLSEESIRNIFISEAPEVDSECKLNALSAWWSKNKDADMTNLWVMLITCNDK